MQIADYLRLHGDKYLWYHVPNQGKMSVQWRLKLARMGVRPGIADFTVVKPGGLTTQVEVKAPNGRQSPAQKDVERLCKKLGIPYHVVHSVDEFIGVIG